MAKYNLTNEERETHIMWSVANKTAIIDTADPAVIRKLDKLAAEHPDVYRETCRDDDYKTKVFEVDARYIRFGKPASEAVKEAAKKTLSKINSAPSETP